MTTMNITLLQLLGGLLLLTIPAYVFYRLDRRLLRQSAVVLCRVAVALLVLGVCLHYVFLWDRPVVSLLWLLLSGAVATAVYCRKRWLAIPIYISMTVCSLVVGLVVLSLTGIRGSLFSAMFLVPVMTMLQADALFVCRRGMTTYVLNRREHASLHEYLQGNGASPGEALRPFVARAMQRSYVPLLSQLLLVAIVFVPSLLIGLLLGAVSVWQSVAIVAMMLAAGLCSTVLALLLSILIYNRLHA